MKNRFQNLPFKFNLQRYSVLVDGKQLDVATFKKVVKYVQQEDILTAVLTVEETLIFSASFYTTVGAVQAEESCQGGESRIPSCRLPSLFQLTHSA